MVIQRIQTLYLLLVAALSVVAAFVSSGSLTLPGAVPPVDVTPFGTPAAPSDAAYCWPGVILLLAAALAMWAIFSFKSLVRQTALVVTVVIMLMAYYAVATLTVSVMCDALDAGYHPGWALCLPFVAILLSVLAIRAIKHDRKLLKDANSMRLRD